MSGIQVKDENHRVAFDKVSSLIANADLDEPCVGSGPEDRQKGWIRVDITEGCSAELDSRSEPRDA